MLSKIRFFVHHPTAIVASVYYKIIMGYFGNHSYILKPMSIDNPSHIYIGNNVLIQQYVWLAANGINNEGCKLEIQDGTTIGHFNHIYSTKDIVIEKNVLIADRVYIGDIKHSYKNINIPIKFQPVENLGAIRIGEGSWIGENVSIIGASVGKHCVIGANSVVTHDIPDYCVAVGSPARIIKNLTIKK